MRLLSSHYLKAMYNLGYKVLCVYGLPGGGKTRTTLSAVVNALSRHKIVISVPLKSLRNWIAREFLPSLGAYSEIVKSKEECCDIVRSCITGNEPFLHYLKKIIETCSRCGEPWCEFKEHVLRFFKSSSGIFVMTHHLSYLLYLMNPSAFRNAVVVIDEADAWSDLYRYVCSEREIEEARQLAKRDKTWREVLRRVLKSCIRFGNMYFTKPTPPLGRLIVLISATLKPSMMRFLNIPDSYTTYMTAIRSKMLDRYILYPRLLSTMSNTPPKYLPPDRWLKYIPEVIVELVDRGFNIGFASRSYSVSRAIYEEVRQYGIDVCCDAVSSEPPRFSSRYRVIIWTTRGRWFRGVSLPDTWVIFCTYQYPSQICPTFREYDQADEDIYELPTVVRACNDAVNVQSYFRTNRVRDRMHITVFLDARAWWAMTSIFSTHAQLTRDREWYDRLRSPTTVQTIDQIPDTVEMLVG